MLKYFFPWVEGDISILPLNTNKNKMDDALFQKAHISSYKDTTENSLAKT